uniref:Uncharacterized protein n=1 Tax=Rhizophora mucronata TaxID=61149 RepID=A0A2P2NBG7_RHIMU
MFQLHCDDEERKMFAWVQTLMYMMAINHIHNAKDYYTRSPTSGSILYIWPTNLSLKTCSLVNIPDYLKKTLC